MRIVHACTRLIAFTLPSVLCFRETNSGPQFRDRAYQDQVHRASCLHLLIAAIGAWMTPYLADALAALRAEGEDVPDELVAHLSPIAWEPVNFLGQFTFDPEQARPLEDRRPLRSGSDDGEEPS